ncbi:MAG: Ig-like domain-containing protein [Eubacteriales bacterium]|nr:Ig-like domain-containing protein [Eubacteriales bacterium]
MKKFLQSLCAVMMLAMLLCIPASAATTGTGGSDYKTKLKLNSVTGETIYGINGKNYALYRGSKAGKKVVIDLNVNEASCTWKSSNTSIATVKKGVVTFKKTGKVKITCITKKQQKMTLTFYVRPIYSIKTNFTKATMKVGATKTIKTTVSPSRALNASFELLSYSSSNKSVATVSKSGKITAVGAGKATITVKTNDGSNRTVKITITVPETDTVSNLTFNYSAAKNQMTFAVNGSMKFSNPTSAKSVMDRIGKYMYNNAGLTGSLNDMWIGDYQIVLNKNGFQLLKNGKGKDQWTAVNGKTYGTETVKTYLTSSKAKTFVRAVVAAGKELKNEHSISGKLTLTRNGSSIVLSSIKVSKSGITFKCNGKSCSMVLSTTGIKITNCPELAKYLVAISGGLLK